MRRLLAVLALVFVALAPTTAASARRIASWSVPIDSRTTDQWLVEADGTIYGPRAGRLVAIDLHNGTMRWRSDVAIVGQGGTHGRTVLAPTVRGLAFVRAADGHTIRTVALGSEPLVAASGTGFVSVTKTTPHDVLIEGWDDGGVLRWHHTYRAPYGKLMRLGGDAIGLTTQSNGTLLVLDARDGRPVAQTGGIDDLIGADGRYLWFNVIGGGIKGLDLDTARTLALHGSVVRGAARVEHGVAVAVVDGRLQRIDLVDDRITPLHVDGRWVAGPTDGRIFLERGDGMYVQRLGDQRARRIARYHGESRLVAADGTIAMVAMEDGRVYVVDVARERRLATISTLCRSYEGFAASDHTTLIHCDGDENVSLLVGFPRYARSNN
jgi:outer membrane protein assembly factor BamB